MLASCGGNGSGSRFHIRHSFRQARYYNRLEPASVIHLVRPNPATQSVEPDRSRDCADRFIPISASSGSLNLFLVPEPQACDTLLTSPQSKRKGTG